MTIELNIQNIDCIYQKKYGLLPVYNKKYDALYFPGSNIRPWKHYRSHYNDMLQNYNILLSTLNLKKFNMSNQKYIKSYTMKYALYYGINYLYVNNYIGFSLGCLRSLLSAFINYLITKTPKNIILIDGPDVKHLLYILVNVSIKYKKTIYTITKKDIDDFYHNSKIMKLSAINNIVNQVQKTYNSFLNIYPIINIDFTLNPLLIHNAIHIVGQYTNNHYLLQNNIKIFNPNTPVYINFNFFIKLYDVIMNNTNIIHLIYTTAQHIEELIKQPNHINNIQQDKQYNILLYNNQIYLYPIDEPTINQKQLCIIHRPIDLEESLEYNENKV